MIRIPAAMSASRRVVSANFVGAGTAKVAGCGLVPTGRLPERVTTTEPSGFVATPGELKDGLVPAGEVVR